MRYEGLMENSTIVIAPGSAVESMQLGSMAGIAALTMGMSQECAKKVKDKELTVQETLQ